MNLLALPPSLLLYILTHTAAATPTFANPRNGSRPNVTTGPFYASSCASAYWSYSSASSSWTQDRETVSNHTQVVGGTRVSTVTYYANATTLCDGHARVEYSPAVALSTAHITASQSILSTSVEAVTRFANFPDSSPSCSIAPSDCDPLWDAFATSLAAWRAHNVTKTQGGATKPTITSPPQTPPCLGQSAASFYAGAEPSVNGCGICTIYGSGVELVYFPVPTTVSRDMCASTPTANLTHYASGAVITAYAGTEYGANATAVPNARTAVVGKNTFTSGTAYISINSVWAEDRCSRTLGSPVSNAILALPSESVLSLRYSQNHFQYFMSSATQTGYPISYADFNQPIPFSAWVGQEQCEGPWDTWNCGVVYENEFRPQLAIPPEIRQLRSEWSGCQMWYGGLYDPPQALTEQASAAMPTRPGQQSAGGGGMGQTTAVAGPSAVAPTSVPTAMPDRYGGPEAGGDTWGQGWSGVAGSSIQGSGAEGTNDGPVATDTVLADPVATSMPDGAASTSSADSGPDFKSSADNPRVATTTVLVDPIATSMASEPSNLSAQTILDSDTVGSPASSTAPVNYGESSPASQGRFSTPTISMNKASSCASPLVDPSTAPPQSSSHSSAASGRDTSSLLSGHAVQQSRESSLLSRTTIITTALSTTTTSPSGFAGTALEAQSSASSGSTAQGGQMSGFDASATATATAGAGAVSRTEILRFGAPLLGVAASFAWL